MVDGVEFDLSLQLTRATQRRALPQEIVGPLPFGFGCRAERPYLNFGKDPMDAAEIGIVATGLLDRLAMRRGCERPDLMPLPVRLGCPVPPDRVLGAQIGRASICRNQQFHRAIVAPMSLWCGSARVHGMGIVPARLKLQAPANSAQQPSRRNLDRRAVARTLGVQHGPHQSQVGKNPKVTK